MAAAAAKPDTILGWHRKLVANKFDGQTLVNRPQILIQPVQCFLNKFVAWDVVTGFVEQAFPWSFLDPSNR